jgi:hypothetical protein
MDRLIAIIPRLPPAIDGIGDYALGLARLLQDNVAITTRFIVADPDWNGTDRVEDFEVRRLTSRSTGELFDLLPGDSNTDRHVLLHYEGYGYANRGCPFWLVDAVERWRRGHEKRSLLTMFHELYATGPPWTSAFWLSPLQKSLARRIALVSDHCFTSLGLYARRVQAMKGKDEAAVSHLPVFSSIAEPVSVSPLKTRNRRLVVFGTRGRRIEVYKRASADLNRICRKLGIEEVLDMGTPIDFNISRVIEVPITRRGELSGIEVSKSLLDAIAGVVAYPEQILGKSTIFAAYCSHGVMPIVAGYEGASSDDGLEANAHYWLTNTASGPLNLELGQVLADNAFAWYQEHNLYTHAKLFEGLIGGELPINRPSINLEGSRRAMV